jgi:predicted metal-dependent hydrolase
MVTGESHYFLGQRYRLNVIEHKGAGKVILRNKTAADLYVRPGSDAARREKILQQWYREQLKTLIPSLLEKWKRVAGVQVTHWGIKKMKTKWGGCNIEDRRIWLNLELAKKPVRHIEYILVHELVHLRERHHNDRFTAIMTQLMPKWQHYKAELNRMPLGHGEWGY